ncbi:hypothetical protein FEM48_Zijuj10G0045000 [Ziziphus jujuba var. spinosa]|uniref:Very-long-chain 3-oxoacyl-CoA reductase-like protein At1g24470 n=1 Tax=Ziziphus jujuba var. spinosa TaxID=714518 RepID=A0A978ULB0_ZIZJJ|nr:hypothetical protein FEM48_Zijuj10G0045000 [Ziziphus jujuba var. spinosa]
MLFTTCIEHLRTQPIWFLLISSLGFFTILKKSATFLNWVFITFIRDPKDLKRYGSWAMVTGSTDGIGKAFAYQLAKKGLNLILVSRNSSKLKSVSKEFQAEFPDTQIKTIAFDFSSNILEGVKEIEEGIKGLEIGILINNVGVSYPSAAYFHEVDEQVWMDIVRVNLEGTTWVSRAVLPGMLQRKRGAIVNIGSGAAIVVPSHPLYTTYAATKSYIDQLSRCLHVEYKHCGIDVQCQVPLYVATKMASDIASIKRSSLFVPSPDDYAEAAIRHIGYEARCTPYWSHWVQWCFAGLLPEAILDSWRLSIGINRRQGKLLIP